MNGLLVEPPACGHVTDRSVREYLGMEYLAAFRGYREYEVALMNCNLSMTAQEAAEVAVTMNREVVSISIPPLPNLPRAFRLIENLHTAGYNGHVILGGSGSIFGCKDNSFDLKIQYVRNTSHFNILFEDRIAEIQEFSNRDQFESERTVYPTCFPWQGRNSSS